jgi:hypothetical protein
MVFVEQLKKQGRTVQELKRRVLKLEFCLEESWSRVRKLHRIETFINLICETQNSSMSFCYVEAEAFLCGKCAQGIEQQLVRVAISEAARKREIKKPPTCSTRRSYIR